MVKFREILVKCALIRRGVVEEFLTIAFFDTLRSHNRWNEAKLILN